ncbi:hypothetical protein HY837_05185 [archaeon]|nr:hypothetical protein [archaeon]
MKKELIILAMLVLFIACTTEPVKKTSQMSSPIPIKEVDLQKGLDMISPELEKYAEVLKNQDAVWFNKLSTKEVLFTIKKGNEFSAEQSEQLCKSTCDACSKRLEKKLISTNFKPDKIKDDSCACGLDQEINGGEYYSCLDEANKNIYSAIFDGLVQRDPSAFPKLNQMHFTFSNFDTKKLSRDFCDNVCNYCATKFNQELDFVSPSITAEGELKCTCQTTDPYGVNLYRLNACLSDLVNIFPSK